MNAMNTEVSSVSALGRLLIALIFIRAGINKLGSIAATAATMRNHGILYADILVWGAIALELGGGLMLVAGLSLIFHPYWTVIDPAEARTQASSFFGHLSMMGGMLFVVAFGAGAYSVDALMTQPSTATVAARRV